MRIGDPGIFLTLDPGWKKFVSGIWDKHPGSAALLTCQMTEMNNVPLRPYGVLFLIRRINFFLLCTGSLSKLDENYT